MDYELIEKIIKNQIRNKKKTESMSKCSMWTQKTTSQNWKFKSNKKIGREWLWMDWEDHLEKYRIRKIEKSKNQSEIATCEKSHYRETEFLFKHRFLALL